MSCTIAGIEWERGVGGSSTYFISPRSAIICMTGCLLQKIFSFWAVTLIPCFFSAIVLEDIKTNTHSPRWTQSINSSTLHLAYPYFFTSGNTVFFCFTSVTVTSMVEDVISITSNCFAWYINELNTLFCKYFLWQTPSLNYCFAAIINLYLLWIMVVKIVCFCIVSHFHLV